MVQQMIDKVSEYRLVSNGNAMPPGNKKHPIAVKKVALRELPNESRNVINKPFGNSPLAKDKGHTSDFVKALSPDAKLTGTKRQQPDGPSSPAGYQVPGKVGCSANIVYVRRKLEAEQSKASPCVNVNNAESLESRKISYNGNREPNAQQDQNQGPVVATLPAHGPAAVASMATLPREISVPHSLGKPFVGLAAPESCDLVVTSGTSVLADPNKIIDQDWRDRFVHLQMYLKNCDHSNQEDYMQMLRSLSALGRSRHAVELEKRAIQLLLEEGKELHRMKILDVLGKASPTDHPSVPSQQSQLQ